MIQKDDSHIARGLAAVAICYLVATSVLGVRSAYDCGSTWYTIVAVMMVFALIPFSAIGVLIAWLNVGSMRSWGIAVGCACAVFLCGWAISNQWHYYNGEAPRIAGSNCAPP